MSINPIVERDLRPTLIYGALTMSAVTFAACGASEVNFSEFEVEEENDGPGDDSTYQDEKGQIALKEKNGGVQLSVAGCQVVLEEGIFTPTPPGGDPRTVSYEYILQTEEGPETVTIQMRPFATIVENPDGMNETRVVFETVSGETTRDIEFSLNLATDEVEGIVFTHEENGARTVDCTLAVDDNAKDNAKTFLVDLFAFSNNTLTDVLREVKGLNPLFPHEEDFRNSLPEGYTAIRDSNVPFEYEPLGVPSSWVQVKTPDGTRYAAYGLLWAEDESFFSLDKVFDEFGNEVDDSAIKPTPTPHVSDVLQDSGSKEGGESQSPDNVQDSLENEPVESPDQMNDTIETSVYKIGRHFVDDQGAVAEGVFPKGNENTEAIIRDGGFVLIQGGIISVKNVDGHAALEIIVEDANDAPFIVHMQLGIFDFLGVLQESAKNSKGESQWDKDSDVVSPERFDDISTQIEEIQRIIDNNTNPETGVIAPSVLTVPLLSPAQLEDPQRASYFTVDEHNKQQLRLFLSGDFGKTAKNEPLIGTKIKY